MTLILFVAAFPQIGRADDLDSIRAAIDGARRSKLCPPNRRYAHLEFEVYCKQWCDHSIVCHGTKETSPCENGDHEGCLRQSEGSGQCLHELNEKNKVIDEYNDIVEQCSRGTKSQEQPPVKPSAALLPKALEEAQKRVNDARSKARETIQNTQQARAAEQAGKSKVNEAANPLQAWCDGMVRACKELGASVANASQATQSRCSVYCRTLQLSNCDGSNQEVQQEARDCTSGLQRDQRAEVERQREAREEKAKEEARRRREEEANFIPPGWIRCPCPEEDMYLVASGRAKLVNGVLYHPRDVGPCGGR
jgi:hypothetical protein